MRTEIEVFASLLKLHSCSETRCKPGARQGRGCRWAPEMTGHIGSWKFGTKKRRGSAADATTATGPLCRGDLMQNILYIHIIKAKTLIYPT